MTIEKKQNMIKILGTALVRVDPIFVVDAKKEPAYRQVLFRMMMYAHTKS